METIDINGNLNQIKKGDYILSYGEHYKFYTGDNRLLKWFGHLRFSKIELPKSIVDKIDFKELKCQKLSNRTIKWIF